MREFREILCAPTTLSTLAVETSSIPDLTRFVFISHFFTFDFFFALLISLFVHWEMSCSFVLWDSLFKARYEFNSFVCSNHFAIFKSRFFCRRTRYSTIAHCPLFFFCVCCIICTLFIVIFFACILPPCECPDKLNLTNIWGCRQAQVGCQFGCKISIAR